jgi:alginate O-acetyltransferase complex protein AlgI
MGLGKWLAKQYFVIRHIYTMLVVILAWVFFRSDNITNAFSYLIAMTGFGKGNDIQFNVGMYSGQEVWFVLLAAILGSVPLKILLEKTILNIPTEFVMLSRFLYLGGVFWVSASYLAAGTYNPFIYFRF